jgi:hypothetical protein
MATKDSTPKAIEEIPLDAIRDLAANYQQVVVRVKRRNDKGQLGTCYSSVRFETMDLAKIDDWCRDMAGGGHYRIEVLRPDDPTKYAMPPFTYRIEGAPRPPRFLGNPQDQTAAQPPPHPGAPMSYPQYPAPPQPWAAGLHPTQRAAYAPPQQVYTPPARSSGTDEPTKIALTQIAELKAEVERIRGDAKTNNQKLEDENKRLQERLDEERRRASEERHAAEIAALRQAIEQKNSAPEVKPSGPADLIAALAPFVPVFTSMISGRNDQASKALEAQMSGVQTLMQATLDQANKGNDMEKLVGTWGPILTPLITKMLDQKSPEAQSAMFQAMADNQLNSVAMMAQLIEAFGTKDGEQPWWLPMVQETLGGVVQMTEAYMQGQGLPGQPPAMRQPPTGALHAPQGAGGYTTMAEPVGTTSGPQAPAPAAVKPGIRLMFTMLPGDYQTVEWKTILEGLHTEPPTAAEQTATLLAGHLEHLINFNLLPETLSTIVANPRETLEALLEKLPIARSNPGHARQVLDLALTYLLEDGFIQEVIEAEIVEAEHVEPEPIVTPAPPEHVVEQAPQEQTLGGMTYQTQPEPVAV